jgi:hypothetical protein
MAPEQMEKPLEVDHRADIYSLGVLFYELLTGELPLGKFAPPSQKAGVDARLDEVVLRAIEKQPEQRYQKMSEMKTDVEAAGQPPTSSLERVVEGVLKVIKTFKEHRWASMGEWGEWAAGEHADPVHGLTAQEEGLCRLLRSCEGNLSHYLSVLPDIEKEVLTTARKRCRAAPEDRILAVLDFSGGEGETGLLFGCGGLYFCNGDDTPHPGTGFLSWADLPGRRFINHGEVVYLGKDQFICPIPDETGIDCEELVSLLNRVRAALAPWPA